MAIEDGGLDLGAIDQTRFGVVVGSAFGGMDTFEKQTLNLDNGKKVSPFTIPQLLGNTASGMIAIELGCQGASRPRPQATRRSCTLHANAIAMAGKHARSRPSMHARSRHHCEHAARHASEAAKHAAMRRATTPPVARARRSSAHTCKMVFLNTAGAPPKI